MSICIAGSLVLLSSSLKSWQFFLLVLLAAYLFSFWKKIPRLKIEIYLAACLAPLLAKLLDPLSALLNPLVTKLKKQNTLPNKIYQLEDLVELIELQSKQNENRVPKDQLKMAIGALTFGSKTVQSIMIPKRLVISAKQTDNVGPILMEELYESGHSRFPVIDKKPERVVGILFLHDIIDLKHSGKVSDVMKKEVFYAHEEHTLDKVFQAFLKTKHHMFIVVNRFEEIVGLITIEDVLEQIIGKEIFDEFDKYEDLKEVANNLAKHDHEKMSTEVIE
jgi:CBS domain containing-hemolysin-like protein